MTCPNIVVFSDSLIRSKASLRSGKNKMEKWKKGRLTIPRYSIAGLNLVWKFPDSVSRFGSPKPKPHTGVWKYVSQLCY